MFNFGLGELIVIFLIVLLLFGAARLPAIAKSLGEAMQAFKKSSKDGDMNGDSEEAKKD